MSPGWDDGRDEGRVAELVAAVGSGDRDPFGVLNGCYRADVHRWVRVRLSGFPDDVEDLVQETFLLAWAMAAEFDPGRWRVGAWLCRWVAPCAVHEFFRRDRFAHRAAVQLAANTLRRGSVETCEQRESRPLSLRMLAALARLTPGQRRAVQLRCLDGLGCAAAGAVAGTTAAAIAARCRDAWVRLRAQLADLAPTGGCWLGSAPKKTALRVVFDAVGPNARAALAWLHGPGVRANTSYAYAQARAARATPDPPAVVAGVSPTAATVDSAASTPRPGTAAAQVGAVAA
jgi:RNA polymerase sigma factor (sigma-70 family)